MNTRTFNPILAIALALVLASGCGRPAGQRAASKPARVEPVSAESVRLVPATAGEILRDIKHSDAEVVLVNVWATYCIPCREEFPDMMRLYSAYKDRGLKLVLVSADFETQTSQARAFLAAQGVDFPSYIKTGKDMAFINGMDPRWSGALPATWVYGSKGAVRHFWEGKATYETFEQKVLDVLKSGVAKIPGRNPS